jgi:hypothetical protein
LLVSAATDSGHISECLLIILIHFWHTKKATGLFYFIWDVDEPARRVWIWRNASLILTWIVCFAGGGLGSELVQSLLPVSTLCCGGKV